MYSKGILQNIGDTGAFAAIKLTPMGGGKSMEATFWLLSYNIRNKWIISYACIYMCVSMYLMERNEMKRMQTSFNENEWFWYLFQNIVSFDVRPFWTHGENT